MEFAGLESTDLDDVRALNAAFLEHLSSADGVALRNQMPAPLRRAITALSHRHIDRLAAVPFLLMSFGVLDDDYWEPTTPDLPVRDLFATDPGRADAGGPIATAALGFIWQLARKNAYAARLVSGAALDWCEHLAACSLLRVLQIAAQETRVLTPRLAADKIFWHRLLGAGLSSCPEIRRAAHLSSLQIVLAERANLPRRRFRSAACYASVPAVQVSKKSNK